MRGAPDGAPLIVEPERGKMPKLAACVLFVALLLGACAPPAPEPGGPGAPDVQTEDSASAGATAAPAATAASPTDVPPTPTADADPAAAEIYAAMIRALLGTDLGFAEPPQWTALYIFDTTDDRVSGLPGAEMNAAPIDPALQADVTAALADLPLTVGWVRTWDELDVNAAGDIDEGQGVVITLGNIYDRAGEDAAEVAAALTCGGMCGTGVLYAVADSGDGWQVTGTVESAAP